MRLFKLLASSIVLSLAGAGSAAAETCALDDVPAATLLLPYFEVDLDDANGRTTLFSLNNAAAEPALVKAVLWTDLAVPTVDFDVYLTGYDVVTVNLRDVFTTGALPSTGSGISPTGLFSLPGQAFPGCAGSQEISLAPSVVEHLRAAHLGEASALFDGACSGVPWQDAMARGFATFDVVRRCESSDPSQPDYFGEDGLAGTRNVLWGDFYYAEPAEDFAQGESLVSLEADPDAFGPGDLTFYARYLEGDASDAREPLPAQWAVRFLSGGAFSGGTDVVTWRETREPMVPFDCDDFPLSELHSEEEFVFFDEDENPDVYECPPGFCLPGDQFFPFAAERTTVGGPHLPVAFDFGWIQFDFARIEGGSYQTQSQAWAGVLHRASGRFSVGTSGTVLGGTCGAAGCRRGEPVEAGRLCVRGEATGNQEYLSPSVPLDVQVIPAGCFSSSCTLVHESSCSVGHGAASGLEVAASFCLASLQGGGPCTADCSGVGVAECTAPAVLGPGTHTIRAGSLELEVTLPSFAPLGGLCVGDPF